MLICFVAIGIYRTYNTYKLLTLVAKYFMYVRAVGRVILQKNGSKTELFLNI